MLFILCLLMTDSASPYDATVVNNEYSFGFRQLSQQQMTTVNDGVMGGVSHSEIITIKDGLRFKGHVSFENNGGFASVRMIWPFNGMGQDAEPTVAVLKVIGDGQIYQFRLRTNRGFDGAAYSYSFKTIVDQVQTVYIPIEDFVATFRGRTLRDMPRLKFSDVQQMGILVADYQVGDFYIDLLQLDLE